MTGGRLQWSNGRDVEFLIVCGTRQVLNPALKTCTPTLLDAYNQTPTLTLGLTVWHADCVLKDDLREILNSYKKGAQYFSSKILNAK